MRRRLIVLLAASVLPIASGSLWIYGRASESSTANPSARAIGHQHFREGAGLEIPGSQPSGAPLVADGRTDANVIPDFVAYRHFVMAVAIPREAPTWAERSRRNHYLNSVRLSLSDRMAVVEAVANVREELKAADEMIKNGPSAAAAASARRETALNGAGERLRLLLSADGQARVDSFVNTKIKPRVRIYGSMPTPR